MVVLVDFDGVILKNARAGHYVKKRICSYIAKSTGIRDMKLIESFNRELYTSHGHTLLGLHKHGFNVNLKDFNNYLYGDRQTYQYLELLPEELSSWNKFMSTMKDNGMSVKLFSNSGIEWMTHFIGYDSSLLEFHDWLDSNYKEHMVYNATLKPERNVYDLLMYKYPNEKYHFIDDKVTNFAYIDRDSRWIKIWLNNEPYDEPGIIRLGNLFYCLKDLEEASQVIIKNR